MRLLKNEIFQNCKTAGSIFFLRYQIPPDKWFDEEYVHALLHGRRDEYLLYRDSIDSLVTMWLAKRARTFLFSTREVLEFPIEKPLAPGHYIAPFSEMIFQFTEPIDQRRLGLTGASHYNTLPEDDAVQALIVGWPPKEGGGVLTEHGTIINVTAYYTSRALNRAIIPIDGNGEVDYERAMGGYIAGGKEDKQKLTNLALWCIAYLNSPGIEIERVPAPPEEVNKKRERKGKARLSEYYILKIKDSRIKYPPNVLPIRVGGKHSFKYDVKSHPRRLPTGKVIIIPAHKRGLDNEEYKPKVYATGQALQDEQKRD